MVGRVVGHENETIMVMAEERNSEDEQLRLVEAHTRLVTSSHGQLTSAIVAR